MKNLSKRQVIDTLRQIMPHGTVVRSITDHNEIVELYQRARNDGLFLDSGSSLHCWDEQYWLEGIRYHFNGVLGTSVVDSVDVYKSWDEIEQEIKLNETLSNA